MTATMTVGQIDEIINRDDRRIVTNLGAIEVADDGRAVSIETEDPDTGEKTREEFTFDEETERVVSKFLDVSPVYMRKCPPSLKAHNLNYWLRNQVDVEATLLVGPKGIETMHDPDKTVVTMPEVAGVISRVFDAGDQIVNLHSDPDVFLADVMVGSSIEVPGNGLGDRPNADGILSLPMTDEDTALVLPEEVRREARVFDITHGGVRVVAYPNQAKAPVVERYFNRLICTNGLTMPVADARVTLRGNTVEEVIADMERAAEHLLGSMDEALERYAALSDIPVVGNVAAFIQQVGIEAGIPAKLIQQAITYAGGAGLLREGAAPTSYDVMNILTSIANNDSVRFSTRNRLQALGGLFVAQGQRLMERCSSCERPMGVLDQHEH